MGAMTPPTKKNIIKSLGVCGRDTLIKFNGFSFKENNIKNPTAAVTANTKDQIIPVLKPDIIRRLSKPMIPIPSLWSWTIRSNTVDSTIRSRPRCSVGKIPLAFAARAATVSMTTNDSKAFRKIFVWIAPIPVSAGLYNHTTEYTNGPRFLESYI